MPDTSIYSRETFKNKELLLPVDPPSTEKPISAWLATQAQELELFTLLAWSTEGVIWGLRNGEQWVLSADVDTTRSWPRLDSRLLCARVFGQSGELLLWRADQSWAARGIGQKNGQGKPLGALRCDEEQVLWGTHAESLEETGFSRLSDGSQGLVHVAPVELTRSNEGRCLRLTVRHYLKQDDFGAWQVVASRLVSLSAVKAKESTHA